MKKKEANGKDGNVIPFPGLEKRLLQKGQELLQQEKFHEAISVFQQAISLENTTSDGYFGLVLAYAGAGRLEEAVLLTRKMLHEDIGDYFSTMDIYIKLLYQMQQYREIVTVIEGLLEERAIPSERLEHYYSLLEMARQLEDTVQEEPVTLEEPVRELRLAAVRNQQEQVMLAAELAKSNIQPYVKEILSYLQEDTGDAFFKTLLLNVLKEHQVEQAVAIYKFAQRMTVIPKNLPSVNDMPQLQEIIVLIRKQIEHEDPILFENVKNLVHRQFFLLYPFSLTGPALPAWAASYHLLGLEYFGNVCIIKDILEKYCVSEPEYMEAISFIRKIEEISSPNI